MDPVTLMVSAVALGAAAVLKDTSHSVKDAYGRLKSLLIRRGVDVTPVERRPDSAVQRLALHETIADAGVGEDDEVLAAAQDLVNAIQAEVPRGQRVWSEGTGVRVMDSRTSGGIDIGARWADNPARRSN